MAHRLDSFHDGIESRNRRERDFSRARTLQDVFSLFGRRLEIVQHCDLRISRSDRPLDLVNRQAQYAGRKATAGLGAAGAGLNNIAMRHGVDRIKPMMATMVAPPVARMA